ncbi:MAG: rhodanese-like domain-containing protein [Moraxellaceae bacterium]
MKRLVVMLLLGLGGAAQAAERVSAEALRTRQAAGEALLVLDVRTPAEYAQGHVPGAINVPHDEVTAAHPRLAAWRERPVVVYCRSGRRSALAIETLEKAGFTRVQHLEGDMLGWQAARQPVARP